MVIKINRAKFFALKPTLIGVVAGVKYYEDPIHGDEATLIAVTNTTIEHTAHYEMDDIQAELDDELYEAARARQSAAIKESIKF
jgi:hypothetical protein